VRADTEAAVRRQSERQFDAAYVLPADAAREEHRRNEGYTRLSLCSHFAVTLQSLCSHFIPGFLSYSVAVFLK
jgi:hypothetical protein